MTPEGIAALVSAGAAVIALFAALFAWLQRPKPNLQLSHFVIDDSAWHSESDVARVKAIVVNHGDAPALSVTLWLRKEGMPRRWMRTSAADYWAAIYPGEAIAYTTHTTLNLWQPKKDLFVSGAGGFAKFDGAKLRVRRLGKFHVPMCKTWDLDRRHRRQGRSTRDLPTLNDN